MKKGPVNDFYTFPKYWQKKVDDKKYLITTDYGSFDFLNEKEMKLFRTNKISKQRKLFSILEKKCIIIDRKNLGSVESLYKNRFSRFFSGIRKHVIFFPSEKDSIISENTGKNLSKFILQSPSKSIKIEFRGKNIFNQIEAVKFITKEIERLNFTKEIDSKGLRRGHKIIEFEIISNLSSFNDEIAEYLLKEKIYLTTYLNGNKELHEKTKKINGDSSYKKIVYWIKKIKSDENGKFLKPPITVAFKEMLSNSQSLVDEIVNRKFSTFRIELPNPSSISFENWKKIGCNSDDYLNLWKNCLEKIVGLNKNGLEIKDYSTIQVLNSIFNPSSLPDTFCNGCCTEAAYDYLGNVFPCGNTVNSETFILGNVNQNNYRKVFTSHDALHFVGLASSVCSFSDLSPWHPYCSPCPGYSYWETNNVIPKIPHDFLWKIISGQVEHIFTELLSKTDSSVLQKWLKENQRL